MAQDNSDGLLFQQVLIHGTFQIWQSFLKTTSMTSCLVAQQQHRQNSLSSTMVQVHQQPLSPVPVIMHCLSPVMEPLEQLMDNPSRLEQQVMSTSLMLIPLLPPQVISPLLVMNSSLVLCRSMVQQLLPTTDLVPLPQP